MTINYIYIYIYIYTKRERERERERDREVLPSHEHVIYVLKPSVHLLCS
jgi:hypothetical protein